MPDITGLGYSRPLYLLPFDHRNSYLIGMFHLTPPVTEKQHKAVTDSKQVIYEGFQQALGAEEVPFASAGILVDEEFGAGILRDAAGKGYVTVLPTEKSGSVEFEFEYGIEFAKHIKAFEPTFAKALVRYNPQGDADLNQRQTARLKQLSDYCRAVGQRFLFELLVPATEAQEQRVQDESTYDLLVRPALVLQAIRTLQDAGVEPDIWKIEGLDRREDYQRVVATTRRDGRDEVGCIVLGRAAAEEKVIGWLETAASVQGFIGFAVGRTTFWEPVADYITKRATRQEAVSRIAQRYRQWAAIFERTKHAGRS